jgi:hypothetical protein
MLLLLWEVFLAVELVYDAFLVREVWQLVRRQSPWLVLSASSLRQIYRVVSRKNGIDKATSECGEKTSMDIKSRFLSLGKHLLASF